MIEAILDLNFIFYHEINANINHISAFLLADKLIVLVIYVDIGFEVTFRQ